MNETATRVQLGKREIILLGTAHVSKESVVEVETTIREEKPDMVCIEIDESRYNSLTKGSSWKDLSIPQVLRKRKGFLLLANLVLSSFQKRLGLDLGVKPGEEMLKAITIAKELGIPYEFCDREIQVTLKRAWSKTGFWGKNKMLAAMISSVFFNEKLSADEIEKLKEKSALQNMLEELAHFMPSVKTVLIDERDRYLATRIFLSKGDKIVAVVGAGHVEGIMQWLESLHEGKVTEDLAEIEEVPPKSIVASALPFVIAFAIIGLMVAGFFVGGITKVLNMLLMWFLINGSLSAVGTIVALGHPLAVIAAFLTAPFTSINPLVPVGLVTGLIEYKFKKPHVEDFEQISTDITSFRGFYRNRFIHILLVFFFSSLGSGIGTFVAGIPMIANLFH
ncbi:MAG: TraB/GumN family protein [Spirochaetales bacterium]|nr:TraB/GumN family protein [Spirochaetales bacterium]